MLYCEKCMSTHYLDRCPFCGNKKVREIRENDAVFLKTEFYPYSGMLESLLKDFGIPCLVLRNDKFLALQASFRTESGEFKFFVPYGALEKAKEVLKDFFDDDDDDDDCEYDDNGENNEQHDVENDEEK